MTKIDFTHPNHPLYEPLGEVYLKVQGKLKCPDWEIHANGKFKKKGSFKRYIHDWEAYISHDMKFCWSLLSKETQTALYIIAEEQADNEEWD